jgi:hypothetical protein
MNYEATARKTQTINPVLFKKVNVELAEWLKLQSTYLASTKP